MVSEGGGVGGGDGGGSESKLRTLGQSGYQSRRALRVYGFVKRIRLIGFVTAKRLPASVKVIDLSNQVPGVA